MHTNDTTPEPPDVFLEALAAELASAAYPVALRHTVRGTWVDLELELWQVLGEVVKRRRHDLTVLPALRAPRGD